MKWTTVKNLGEMFTTPASQKPEDDMNQVYMNQTAGGKYTEASFTVTLN